MRKTMELLWTLIFFSLFIYCLYVIKLGEVKLERNLKKRQYSESSKSFLVLPEKTADTDESRFSKICKNSSVLHLKDYCIVTYGNNKQAVFVENVCVENRIMVNGIQHKSIYPVNVKGSQKFIVVYNASSNFTKQFHYFNVIFTTLPLPLWNTFSERLHVLFMPNLRKLLKNLHHFLNDFAVGVYSLMIKFNFLCQYVNR